MVRYSLIMILAFSLAIMCTPQSINNSDCITYELNRTLVIGQWNVFMFGMVDDNCGSHSDLSNEEIFHLQAIIDSLNADVLFLNEYYPFLDQAKTKETYSVLLQEYPFFFRGGFYCAVASKYPISMREESFESRCYIVGTIDLGTNKAGLACIHPIPDFGDDSYKERINDHKRAIEFMLPYKNAIIAGDFNTKSVTELDVYKEYGYFFCNRGIFGELITYPGNNRSLDNIMIKGFPVLSYVVVEDSVISDHYPSIASIKYQY